jgi:DUF1009 family protein
MDELEEMGFEFIDPKPYLEELLAGRGTLNRLEPSSQAMEDGLFGFPIAKEIAQLDVGQTIVVKERTGKRGSDGGHPRSHIQGWQAGGQGL